MNTDETRYAYVYIYLGLYGLFIYTLRNTEEVKFAFRYFCNTKPIYIYYGTYVCLVFYLRYANRLVNVPLVIALLATQDASKNT